MRVLIITRNFPPEHGGIQRLMLHTALELSQEFEITLIGPRGAAAALPQIRIEEISPKPLWRFFASALWQAMVAARRFRPDIILAGSGLTAPFAWIAAKLARGRMCVYVHGLDLIADHPIYRWFWRPFIRRTDLCIANSRNTVRLAVAIGVPEPVITIIHPGVEIPVPESVSGNFRERFGIGHGPMLLSVGRLIARKGLLEFVENSLPAIVAKYPDARLVILGDEVPDLLSGDSSALGARIRQRADDLDLSSNLLFIGPQDDATLAAAYRAADVHVFPVREVPGDVEGFGMVALEAAIFGLPTVAFAAGGVPDALKEGASGYLVSPGDYAMFALRVMEALQGTNRTRLRAESTVFAKSFCWQNFGSQMRARLMQLSTGLAGEK